MHESDNGQRFFRLIRPLHYLCIISGLNMCWIESDLNGTATVTPILDGNHVKRGKTAHLVTLQALFIQYQNVFFQCFREELKHLQELLRKLADVCTNGKKHEVREANANLMRAIESLRIIEKMTMFDAAQEKKLYEEAEAADLEDQRKSVEVVDKGESGRVTEGQVSLC